MYRTLQVYNPRSDRISYSATGETNAGFIRSLMNAWSLGDLGGQTRVQIEMDADIAFYSVC